MGRAETSSRCFFILVNLFSFFPGGSLLFSFKEMSVLQVFSGDQVCKLLQLFEDDS